MNNWKLIPSIVLATVLIFGAGVFTGGLLVNHVKPGTKKKLAVTIQPTNLISTNASMNFAAGSSFKFSNPLPEMFTKPFLMKLDEQLHLSAEQHKAIEKIINEGQDDIKKVMRNSRLEIREILTAEQVKQFDNLVKRPNRKAMGTNNTSALSPEAQVILLEALRLKNQATSTGVLPSPAVSPTNAP